MDMYIKEGQKIRSKVLWWLEAVSPPAVTSRLSDYSIRASLQ